MPAEIRNPYDSTVPLPPPYQGLLRPGEARVVPAAVEEVLALGVGGLRVRDVPDSRGSVSFSVLGETIGPLKLFVDVATGNDNSIGSQAAPLASITEAESRIPDLVRHEVVIVVQPHSGAGYAWPTFRARIFSGALATIYVIFPEVNVIVSDVAQSGTTIEKLVADAGLFLTPGALDGMTIEILDGDAAGDRRTIRDNGATDIVPCAEFSAIPTGASYRIFEPDAGNVVITTDFVPMVQGVGIMGGIGPSDSGADGSDGEYSPGVNIVNAIISVTINTNLVSDGRLILLGCVITNLGTLVRYHGQGQFLMGRQAWTTVVPPSTEPTLTSSSWVGWGVHFIGGHFVAWLGPIPYVSGFLVTDERYVAFGGEHHITGHIKGVLRAKGQDPSERAPVRISFGKPAPFASAPSMVPGKISANNDVFPAVGAEQNSFVQLYDETTITNLGTTPVILVQLGGILRAEKQIILAGINGGDGVQVITGGDMSITALSIHTSIDLQGTVAGQLFSIGPRALDATMADDFNNVGDFVSGARGFWDTGLAVTANAVTLATKGTVVAAEATTASATGPKQLQNSATPGAGAAQVVYDAQGFAMITFNGADAVTVADIYIQPEDDGTVVHAIV
ncbi:hypothetical protein LCGC14_1282650 [marine sediment metagenome]|uniref:Uncharacterized protein n=1 Tax=marine sediment metagenome TaxID=412755 RepID=A0A0F9LFU9_9ZZZZ